MGQRRQVRRHEAGVTGSIRTELRYKVVAVVVLVTCGIRNMLYTEILPDDTDQPGITKQQFETAVSVWTWMQPGNEAPTVAATAASFNTTPEIVRQCVRESEWMFLDGPDDDPTKQRVETHEADEQQSPPSVPSGRY